MMFEVAEFQRKRKGKFGAEFYYFDELDSTNVLAEQLAAQGSLQGTVVLANCQTGGKGRNGASWFSPRDVNLYFTVILRPPASYLKYLPFVAALSVIRALSAIGIESGLKWPNDVLVAEKKISGILITTSMEENRLNFAAMGVGININSTEFPSELKPTATSVAQELGHPVSRDSFLASFLLELENLYERIKEMIWEEFCRELEAHSSYLRGCDVRVHGNDSVCEGTTRGLDASGGLILDTDRGRQVFYAGEVRSCRKK